MVYVRPEVLYQWELNEPDREYYSVLIYSNETIVFSVGRYAHSSGSATLSWHDFLLNPKQHKTDIVFGDEIYHMIKSQVIKLVANRG